MFNNLFDAKQRADLAKSIESQLKLAPNSKVRSLVHRRQTNEVFALITEDEKSASLAQMSLDSGKANLYQIKWDVPDKHDGTEWTFKLCGDFDEIPTTLALNHLENCFLVYGSGVCMVGMLPDPTADERYLLVEPVTVLEDQGEIVQAEFSNLNPNYLLVLVRILGQDWLNTIDLTSAGLKSESKNKLESRSKFVSFAQSNKQSSVMESFFGLAAFEIYLMTEAGEIFVLNPVLLGTFSLRERDFSSLIVQVKDANAKEFLAALVEGKQKADHINRGNMCQVSLSRARLARLQPKLVGPIDSGNKVIDGAEKILSVSVVPKALLRLQSNCIDLLVSFDQPELNFATNSTSGDMSSFVCINSVKIPNVRSRKLYSDPTNENIVYLMGNPPLKLDLTCVEKMRDSFLDGTELSAQATMVVSEFECGNAAEKIAFNQILVGCSNGAGRISIDIRLQNKEQDAPNSVKLGEKFAEIDQESKRAKDAILHGGEPNLDYWKPPRDWISQIHLQKNPAPVKGQSDLSMEQFKNFTDEFAKHYLGHFDGTNFDKIFEHKINSIAKVKEQVGEKATKIEQTQGDSEQKYGRIQDKLGKVQSQNDLIREKIQAIQDKLVNQHQQLQGNQEEKDDFTLQLYLNQLKGQVTERTTQLLQSVRGIKVVSENDAMLGNQIAQIPMDSEQGRQLRAFVDEHKPMVKEVQDKLDRLKVQHN